MLKIHLRPGAFSPSRLLMAFSTSSKKKGLCSTLCPLLICWNNLSSRLASISHFPCTNCLKSDDFPLLLLVFHQFPKFLCSRLTLPYISIFNLVKELCIFITNLYPQEFGPLPPRNFVQLCQFLQFQHSSYLNTICAFVSHYLPPKTCWE